MSNELDKLKSTWSQYPKTIDHLINAQIQAERLRALNNIIRIQQAVFEDVGGLIRPTISKDTFSNLKNQTKKSIKSIRRIILAEGAKGVGPYEDLPSGLKTNLNAYRYTYREKDLAKLAEASQQSTQNDNDVVNLFSKDNLYYDSENKEFDSLHLDKTDTKRASEEMSLLPSVEGSMLDSPIEERKLQFKFWEPSLDSTSQTDPELLKNQFNKLDNYSLSKGLEKLRESGNTGVFRFKMLNLATDQEESFPAYIQTLVETHSPSWNSMDFPNRSESIYVYQKNDRSFNMDFYVLATKHDNNEKETEDQYTVYTVNGQSTLDVIGKDDLWRKINFLESLCYPKYDGNGKFSKSPFGRLWIANLFIGIPFIVEGLTVNYDPLIWNLNTNDVKPMIAQINMSGKFIHPRPLSAKSDYYGDFYNV